MVGSPQDDSQSSDDVTLESGSGPGVSAVPARDPARDAS